MGSGKGKTRRTKTQTTTTNAPKKQAIKSIEAIEFQKLVNNAAGESLTIGIIDQNERTIIKDANLTNKILKNIEFLNCELKNCDFEAKELKNCKLKYCTITGGKWKFAQFLNSKLRGVVWKDVKEDAKFIKIDRCEVDHFSLIGSELQSMNITDCGNIDGFFVDKNSSIENSHIESSNMHQFRIDGDANSLMLQKIKCDEGEFRDHALIDSSLIKSDFKNSDFSKTTKATLNTIAMSESKFDVCNFGEFNLILAEKIQDCVFNNCVNNRNDTGNGKQ